MCENHSEIALKHTRDEVIPMLATAGTCSIGNVAAHLMLLPEDERAQYDTPIGGWICVLC